MAKLDDLHDDFDLEDDDIDTVEETGKKKKRSVGKIFLGLIFVALVAVVILIVVKGVLDKLEEEKKPKPSKVKVGIDNMFEVKEGNYPLVLDGEISEYRIFDYEGVLYINLEFVIENIECRYYYDKETDAYLYTSAQGTSEFKVGSTTYTDSTGATVEAGLKPIIETANGHYLALEFVNYGRVMCQYYVYEEPKRVSLWTQGMENTFDNRELKEATALREGPSITKNILVELEKGERLTLAQTDVEDEDFYYVFVRGVYGYVEKSAVNETIVDNYYVVNEPFAESKRDHNIYLGWAQVTNKTANDGIMSKVNSTSGLNTISPTWYYIGNETGVVESIASETVTNELHKAGYEVWPLVSDFTNDIDTEALLSSRAARKKIIDTLMAEAKQYGYDGYNIDFEDIKLEGGDDYLQFLRELSIECNKINIVLSTDNYVPMEHTAFYNRTEQGKVVDYLVVMGYDEHYGGSPEAGSVASLPFVTEGTKNTIDMVGDSKRVILAMPFYTRLWTETTVDGEMTLKSTTYMMDSLIRKMKENNAEIIWDETLGQYYAEYTVENVVYRAWLEDERSLVEKFKVAQKLELGGVAFWRLGLEESYIYGVLAEFMK